MTTQPKRILLIAGDLDHRHLAASYRALKLLKYLPKLGCECTAVTPVGPGPGFRTPRGVEIVYIRDTFAAWPIMFRILLRLVVLPEPQRLWTRTAEARLQALAEAGAWHFTIVTTPPHSLQALGGVAKRAGRMPVLADLRDDWLTNDRIRWITPLHRASAAHWERLMVEQSDAIAVSTEVVRGRYRKRYPIAADKFAMIPLGYDEDDFRPMESLGFSPDRAGGLRVFYGGASYGGYMPSQLERLAATIQTRPDRADWRIVSAGAGSWPSPGKRGVWEHLGCLSQTDVAREMMNADVLLLAMPPGEREPSGTVPLKAYSYLRSGKSIVYLGEMGSTVDVLAPFPGTYLLPRAAWADLTTWLAAKRDELRLEHQRPGVEKYRCDNMARQFLELANRLRPFGADSPVLAN